MRALALAVLVMVAAAGCADKGGSAGGTGTAQATTTATTAAAATSTSGQPPAPTANPPRTATLTGCTNFGGVYPVPMDAARAVLPDGFQPVPASGDPLGGATLYVLALKCDAASVDGKSLGPALLAYEELAVVPDAAHKVAGIADYTVPLLFSATPKELGDLLTVLRLGKAGAGSVAWDETATGGIAAQASLGGDGFTLAGQASPAPPAALASGSFVLFGVQDRQVVSVVNGTAEGGQARQAVAALQAQGNPPLLDQAAPADLGFSVAGFSLTYTEAA